MKLNKLINSNYNPVSSVTLYTVYGKIKGEEA